MNMCRSGKHDKDETGQDESGRCIECRRATNRKFNRIRNRAQGQTVRDPDKCQSGIHPKTGPGPCSACADAKRARKLAAQRTKRQNRSGPSGRRHVEPIPVDGFEEDYGPCPARVPNRDWYDQVIVDRVVHGYPSGRAPYPLEWAAIFARTDKTYPELAELTGLAWETIRFRQQRKVVNPSG